MCGIAGFFNLSDTSALGRMTDLLAHRGPDDADVRYFPEERTGLGHRRLSIIDLSPAGRQPMSNADESLWITYNGEIYNFLELRSELEERGHRFKSRTDTEVILRLYEEEGADCVKRLNGMFAFALLDRRRRKIVLARDHFGIKPLYYHHENGRFIFASEIKSILASNAYQPEINWQAARDFFTYLYVPCPETIFRGIHQLPPAHVAELDLESNALESRRYWQPRPTENGNGSGRDDKSKLRALLSDSVKRQMISDVPLGVFLSGGVDSPILTGLMAQSSSNKTKTFTVVFRGEGLEFYDESDAARKVAEKFETEHHEIEVDLNDPLEMLELVRHFDQPFGNPTFYLMYLISKHTRQAATVALCGAGGDELFAGYPRYRAMKMARWLRRVPRSVLAGVRGALNLASDNHRKMNLRRARQLLDGLNEDEVRQFVNWTYFLTEEQKKGLLNQLTFEGANAQGRFLPADRIVRRHLEESFLEDSGNRILQVDMETFLPDNILEYTDKMSMAHSLEVRVPYLDYRFVEHSLQIPFHEKLQGGKGKAILKEVFADLFPEGHLSRPKKGFNFPLGVWMRERFDRYFTENLSRAEVERHGFFNFDYIESLRVQHQAGKADNSYALFSIIMFDKWFRDYILEEDAVGV